MMTNHWHFNPASNSFTTDTRIYQRYPAGDVSSDDEDPLHPAITKMFDRIFVRRNVGRFAWWELR